MRSFNCVWLAVCGASLLSAADKPPQKVALLVGVNEYQKPGFKPLQFAEADVLAVSAELRKLGFSTRVLLGSGTGASCATRANIETAAREMVAPLGQNDVALVMLSGHGQQLSHDPEEVDLDKSQSYYCPVDAIVNRPETQFALSHLVDDILAPNVGKKLLLVDACRDIPIDRSRGRNVKGIEGRVVSLPEGTGVFFSCSAGQTSFERDELRHGLFTHCVLEALQGAAVQRGELAWSGLVAHVDRRMSEPDIVQYMPGQLRQVPIPAGAMPYTVLGRVAPPPAVTQPKPPPAAVQPRPAPVRRSLKLTGHSIQGGIAFGTRVTLEINGEQVTGVATLDTGTQFEVRGTLKGTRLTTTNTRDNAVWSTWNATLDLQSGTMIGRFTPAARADANPDAGTLSFTIDQ